jgi:uncharacterized protein YbjT (DUF2867 family)
LHKDQEDAIRNSGLSGKFVRPSGFMSNSFQWIGSIKSESVVYSPTGSGKGAPIAPSDVAAVVVKALTEPSLADEVFEVTGSELLSAQEQVRILSDVLGKTIRCVDVTFEAAVAEQVRAGIPAYLATAVAQVFEAIRDGRAAAVTGAFERVTGRKPETFETWVREHASRFA